MGGCRANLNRTNLAGLNLNNVVLRNVGAAGANFSRSLLVSADLDELLRLSDRVVVLFNGRIVAHLENGPDITPATLGPYMLGTKVAA